MIVERDIYEELKLSEKPVIIYGMGNGADKILAEFEKCGITVSGIAASDDFVRGQSFHGFTVQKVSDFEKKYGSMIIIIAFGTCLPEVMERIFSLGERHIVLAADVPVYGDNIWNRSFGDRRDAGRGGRNAESQGDPEGSGKPYPPAGW